MSQIDTVLLPCELTQEEKEKLGGELARETQLWHAAEESKKESAAAFKKQVDEHKAEMRRLARLIATGRQDRDVECFWQHTADFEMYRLIRSDTGEVVRERPLTKEEKEALRQEELFPSVPQLGEKRFLAPEAPPVPALPETIDGEFEEVTE